MSTNQSPNVVSRIVVWFSIGLLAFLFLAVYFDREHKRETEHNASVTTTVWIPGPADMGFRPYPNAQVIERRPDYIRFATLDGSVIEQHGTYRIEERPNY